MKPILREWRAFLVALQFLTRLSFFRLPQSAIHVAWSDSLVWYPAVGLVIGLILWVVGAVLVATTSLFLAATLVLVVWVAITGALHLDGVADCADAWVGGLGDRQKVLRILKDPRCGSMAVVSLILLLLTKLAALQLLLAAPRWWEIVVIPLVARSLVPLAFLTSDYISVSGLGSGLAEGLSPRRVYVVLVTVILGLKFSLPWQHLVLLALVTTFIFMSWRRACYRRLNGFNGDCAGALVELTEVGLLLCLALLPGEVSV